MVRECGKQDGRGTREGDSSSDEGAIACVHRTGWPVFRRPLGHGLQRRGGFTLIELMVAIVVLLIGALAAFGTQITSGQMIDFSRDVTVAVSDLEMCMEQVLLQTADDMPLVYPEGNPVAAFNNLHLRNEDITPTYLNWDAGEPVPDPLEIELAATWLDGSGRIQRQTLLTAKSR